MPLESPYYKNNFSVVSKMDALAKARPVFKTWVNDGSILVLKHEHSGDADAGRVAQNLKQVNNAMKVVSDGYTSKPLSAAEARAVDEFLQDSIDGAAACGLELDDVLKEVKQAHDAPGAWVKMLLVDKIATLEDALEDLKKGDKTGVRKIAASLNAPGGFEKLGEVVAVDMFNQNNDRFSPQGGTPNPRVHAKEKNFKTLVNLGNVIMVLRKGADTGMFVGMDAYDATSDQQVAFNPLQGPGDPSTYFGNMLAPNQRPTRIEFCKNICADLEAAWGPRDRDTILGTKKRLKKQGPDRMESGMQDAAQKLRIKLQNMATKPNPPAWVAQRLAVLGTARVG